MNNELTNIPIKEILTDFAPKYVESILAADSETRNLDGTEFSMSMNVSGDSYNYIAKNGKNVIVSNEEIESPMVKLIISRENLEHMIANQSLDMITGFQSNLNKSKYDIIKGLAGTMKIDMTNEDGSMYNIEVIFNGASEPYAAFSMKTSDSIALAKKEENPVNLFMSGAMKIDGDMGFALRTQPLFT